MNAERIVEIVQSCTKMFAKPDRANSEDVQVRAPELTEVD